MSSTPCSRVLALVDCNNFYVSCERVFQPRLEGRPVIVLSNNDGCVVARSQEIRDLGVPMGIPFHEIRDLVSRHNVAVFSFNYALYGDMSARVQKAGVMLLDLAPAAMGQRSLFEPGDDDRSMRLMRTLDRINEKLGKGTLRYAGEGFKRPWDRRAGRRTPTYTTRWEDLPVVRGR